MTDPQLTAALAPKAGESWRNDCGTIRIVRAVDPDGVITYSTSANDHQEWWSGMLRDWALWVKGTHAVLLHPMPPPEVSLTAALARLRAWAFSEEAGADLPEHYPNTYRGTEDVQALVRAVEALACKT